MATGKFSGLVRSAIGNLTAKRSVDVRAGWQLWRANTKAEVDAEVAAGAFVDLSVGNLTAAAMLAVPDECQLVAIRALAKDTGNTVTLKVVGYPPAGVAPAGSDGAEGGEVLLAAQLFTCATNKSETLGQATEASYFLSDTYYLDTRGCERLVVKYGAASVSASGVIEIHARAL